MDNPDDSILYSIRYDSHNMVNIAYYYLLFKELESFDN